MLNYHELTMTESKDSPQKKKQFGVVCTVILAGVLYSMLTSGAFQAVDPVEGIFPGGHFCYKLVSRDYASSRGLGRSIMEDYKKAELAKQNSDSPSRVPSIEEDLYHVFMDDPKMSINAFRRRYMTGILVSNKGKDKIKTLMSLNDKEMKKEFSFDEYHDLNAGDIFDKTPYERGELPSVDSLVLQFPFNGGLGSMFVQSHKIIPQMRRLAKEKGEKGNVPVVISSCSKEQQMCTHYAPLVQGKKFLLGNPDSESFIQSLPVEDMLNWRGMQKTLDDGKMKVGKFLGIL